MLTNLLEFCYFLPVFLITSSFHHFSRYNRVKITNSHNLVPFVEARPPSSLFHLVMSWRPKTQSSHLLLLFLSGWFPGQNGTWRWRSAAILAQAMSLNVRISKCGAARVVLHFCNCLCFRSALHSKVETLTFLILYHENIVPLHLASFTGTT